MPIILVWGSSFKTSIEAGKAANVDVFLGGMIGLFFVMYLTSRTAYTQYASIVTITLIYATPYMLFAVVPNLGKSMEEASFFNLFASTIVSLLSVTLLGGKQVSKLQKTLIFICKLLQNNANF